MALTSIQRYVLKQLNKGQEIDGIFIKMLIDDFAHTASHKKELYDRYTISNVPVFNRRMPEGTKINNKLNNDFVGEIIDTKVGYLFGNPIKYSIDKNMYDGLDQQYKDHQGHVNRFVVRNRMNDMDIELGKLVSICGVAGREIYIDKDGNERLANLNSWEVIYLTNAHDEVEYALRFYTELRSIDNKLVDVIVVEFFDADKITYFVEAKAKNRGKVTTSFVLDDEKLINPKQHVFGITPIIKIVNNEEEMGDTERVQALIDAFDRTMSDINSEIEQFRLAYMYFKGEEPTPEMLDNARQSGGFYVGQDGEVGFITKNINDQVVEHHLDRLEAGITRFSKHVKLSDKEFGNNLSGVAIKYKLMALENKSQILEVKMKSTLLRQFEILSNVWAKKGIVIDYLNVFFDFNRNLPANLLDEADTSMKLKGLVSEHTRLGQLSFVDDIYYEMEQMAEDQQRIGAVIPTEQPIADRLNLSTLNNLDGNGNSVDTTTKGV